MSDDRYLALLRLLRKGEAGPEERAALLREVERRGEKGSDLYEALRVDLWLPGQGELLVAPVASTAVKPGAPLHLIEWSGARDAYRGNVKPREDGDAQIRCARANSASIPRELWRWGEPTCRNCEGILPLTERSILRRRYGPYYWLEATEEHQRRAKEEAYRRVLHGARRLVFPWDTRTLDQIEGRDKQGRLFA